jgi:hypothetical protein
MTAKAFGEENTIHSSFTVDFHTMFLYKLIHQSSLSQVFHCHASLDIRSNNINKPVYYT